MNFNIFDWFRKEQPIQEDRSVFIGTALNYSELTSYTQSKALLLSAVYRCVEVISDSIAQLPLKVYIKEDGFLSEFYSHPTYNLLDRQPNKIMTRFTLLKTLVVSMLLKGNGYALIKRDEKGNAIEIKVISPDLVKVKYDGTNLFYIITEKGTTSTVESINMIHLRNFSYDGLLGISTIQHASNTLALATDSELHASKFFKSGANVSGILKKQGSLTTAQKEAIKSAWGMAFNGSTGGVAVLEGDMEFQPITINPADAQLIETRQFNVVDICRFFGVSPVKAFDLSNSSYATVEATQLAFLTDTIAPLVSKIELEFTTKLYKPSEINIEVKFDIDQLLRADKQATAEYFTKLFNAGALSQNDIRKAIGQSRIENGDIYLVMSNLSTVEEIISRTKSKKNE